MSKVRLKKFVLDSTTPSDSRLYVYVSVKGHNLSLGCFVTPVTGVVRATLRWLTDCCAANYNVREDNTKTPVFYCSKCSDQKPSWGEDYDTHEQIIRTTERSLSDGEVESVVGLSPYLSGYDGVIETNLIAQEVREVYDSLYGRVMGLGIVDITDRFDADDVTRLQREVATLSLRLKEKLPYAILTPKVTRGRVLP